MTDYLYTIYSLAHSAVSQPDAKGRHLEALQHILRVIDLANKNEAKTQQDWANAMKYYGLEQ